MAGTSKEATIKNLEEELAEVKVKLMKSEKLNLILEKHSHLVEAHLRSQSATINKLQRQLKSSKSDQNGKEPSSDEYVGLPVFKRKWSRLISDDEESVCANKSGSDTEVEDADITDKNGDKGKANVSMKLSSMTVGSYKSPSPPTTQLPRLLWSPINGKQDFSSPLGSCSKPIELDDDENSPPNPVDMIICRKCTFPVPNRAMLLAHLQSIHLKQKPFECKVEGCEARYNYHYQLVQHKEKEHNILPKDRQNSSTSSNSKSSSDSSTSSKASDSNPEKRFRCDTSGCGHKAKSEKDLKTHKRHRHPNFPILKSPT